ncbi:fatty-acyl-CoA synthase [Nitrosomonas sp. PY1]|uniref:long-chain-fatty-acid--CoA ligase n=1 Tax=Nitrosomonas sp. PY1 TaxID=1803906 RepID=UPI001FC84D9D|nr:long-chain-fatty-acid--CoA ligase [Nitrosomonas sp. PY1]GKS68601.1 fatty-acyl-CoA synthase [Nitrosomonas sp. PY1]
MTSNYQLLLKQIWHTTLVNAADRPIIYHDRYRSNYRQTYARINRFAAAMAASNIKQGDVIAVMDHDSHRYLECYFAIPMYGAVMMTVNSRLTPAQIIYTLNHSQAILLLLHTDFIPVIESIRSQLTGIRKIIVLSDGDALPFTSLSLDDEYENWLKDRSDHFVFSDFDENTRATVFYTTGTTGLPKGVFYTHRQLMLHTLAAGMALAMPAREQRFHAGDVYMPLTPMFHVHAWGIPYIATLLGVKQVYPGRYTAESLLRLIIQERVTFSHCVPTILKMILVTAQAVGADLRGWKVVVGGSALSRDLARQALDMGIDCFSGYGLSETAPILTLAQLIEEPDHTISPMHEDASMIQRCSAGRAIPLVDIQIINEATQLQVRDGRSNGEIAVRAPWLTQGYLNDSEASVTLWQGGYLHTQDIGTMSADGYLYITDRLKDVIKVAGEWVSSLEVENALASVAGVREVAVIGIPDSRWGERPLALLVVDSAMFDESAVQQQIRSLVSQGVISKHALLTQLKQVECIVKTSVGKVDKKALRCEHGVVHR